MPNETQACCRIGISRMPFPSMMASSMDQPPCQERMTKVRRKVVAAQSRRRRCQGSFLVVERRVAMEKQFLSQSTTVPIGQLMTDLQKEQKKKHRSFTTK